ncbi:MAG: hypothetical protein M3Q48_07720, partial [Actinomycetota bacterium]|nr:hypothetical protein [Actinomycetota bacterium]
HSVKMIDGAGNLYVADTGNHRVRRVDPSGMIATVAGTGTRGFGGDGERGVGARLTAPAGVAVDGETPANLFVADTGNHRVRRVDGSTGVISTVVGTGQAGFGGDGGDARAARLDSPFGVAVRPNGELLVADTGNARVRLVATPRSDGVRLVRTLAGNGTASHPAATVEAPGGQLAGASSVATWIRPADDDEEEDSAPELVTFLADPFDHSVKMIDGAGNLRTIAGNGRPGFAGDGGPATAARLAYPFGVAVDRSSPPRALYVADTFNNVVRRIDLGPDGETPGTIRTVAGDGRAGFAGDGGPATTARMSFPTGVAVDGGGDLFVADAYNARIRRVDAGGTISTIAGTGRLGSAGDGGPASAAELFFPLGVAVDAAGPPDVYIADSFNHRIRRVDAATGVVTTVAGNGAPGDGPDGAPATTARLHRPWGVAVAADGTGDVLVADSGNHRIRRIDAATALMSALAATGQPGRQGDLRPAVRARVSEPRGVVHVDEGRGGVVLAADSFSSRLRQVGLAAADAPTTTEFRTEAFAIGCTSDCVVRTINVENETHNTLRIDHVTLAGAAPGDYRVSRDACSGRPLAPGDDCGVRVTFVPTAPCPSAAPCRNAVLRLAGNGADSPLEVRLRGAVEVPSCYGRQATLVGTQGDDVLVGTEGPDIIHGGPGNDRIRGLGGDDVICGGDGDDGVDATGQTLDGGPGADLVLGGPGADSITGNSGDDVLLGQDGDDYLDGGLGGCCDTATNTGDDILFGGDGNDRLFAADFGRAYMAGEGGNDAISGYDGADVIVGGSGDDTAISAGPGNDVVDIADGFIGNDAGDAGDGDDTCFTDGGAEIVLNCDDDPPTPIG